MRAVVRLLPLAVLLANSILHAQDLPATTRLVETILPDDPTPWLGLSSNEASGRLGLPLETENLFGEASLGAGTVERFGGGLSLYLYEDRLWQIRFAEGYLGSVYGIFVGDPAEKVVSTLGTPWSVSGQVLMYRLAWRGYPVRLRIVVTDGKASDIYLYRADL